MTVAKCVRDQIKLRRCLPSWQSVSDWNTYNCWKNTSRLRKTFFQVKQTQKVRCLFILVTQYKALRFQSHWQISNIICSVARLQNLAFIEVSPSPLFMFMVGWISNCEIEILKWFRGDPPPHTPFYSTSHSDSLWFFQCFILYIIWCINKKKLLFHSNQFLSSKCLISDLRKRQVLLGATINFWLRLAT